MSGQRQAIIENPKIKVLTNKTADLGSEQERAAAYKAFANDFREMTGSKPISMDALMGKQSRDN